MSAIFNDAADPLSPSVSGPLHPSSSLNPTESIPFESSPQPAAVSSELSNGSSTSSDSSSAEDPSSSASATSSSSSATSSASFSAVDVSSASATSSNLLCQSVVSSDTLLTECMQRYNDAVSQLKQLKGEGETQPAGVDSSNDTDLLQKAQDRVNQTQALLLKATQDAEKRKAEAEQELQKLQEETYARESIAIIKKHENGKTFEFESLPFHTWQPVVVDDVNKCADIYRHLEAAEEKARETEAKLHADEVAAAKARETEAKLHADEVAAAKARETEAKLHADKAKLTPRSFARMQLRIEHQQSSLLLDGYSSGTRAVLTDRSNGSPVILNQHAHRICLVHEYSEFTNSQGKLQPCYIPMWKFPHVFTDNYNSQDESLLNALYLSNIEHHLDSDGTKLNVTKADIEREYMKMVNAVAKTMLDQAKRCIEPSAEASFVRTYENIIKLSDKSFSKDTLKQFLENHTDLDSYITIIKKVRFDVLPLLDYEPYRSIDGGEPDELPCELVYMCYSSLVGRSIPYQTYDSMCGLLIPRRSWTNRLAELNPNDDDIHRLDNALQQKPKKQELSPKCKFLQTAEYSSDYKKGVFRYSALWPAEKYLYSTWNNPFVNLRPVTLTPLYFAYPPAISWFVTPFHATSRWTARTGSIVEFTDKNGKSRFMQVVNTLARLSTQVADHHYSHCTDTEAKKIMEEFPSKNEEIDYLKKDRTPTKTPTGEIPVLPPVLIGMLAGIVYPDDMVIGEFPTKPNPIELQIDQQALRIRQIAYLQSKYDADKNHNFVEIIAPESVVRVHSSFNSAGPPADAVIGVKVKDVVHESLALNISKIAPLVFPNELSDVILNQVIEAAEKLGFELPSEDTHQRLRSDRNSFINRILPKTTASKSLPKDHSLELLSMFSAQGPYPLAKELISNPFAHGALHESVGVQTKHIDLDLGVQEVFKFPPVTLAASTSEVPIKWSNTQYGKIDATLGYSPIPPASFYIDHGTHEIRFVVPDLTGKDESRFVVMATQIKEQIIDKLRQKSPHNSEEMLAYKPSEAVLSCKGLTSPVMYADPISPIQKKKLYSNANWIWYAFHQDFVDKSIQSSSASVLYRDSHNNSLIVSALKQYLSLDLQLLLLSSYYNFTEWVTHGDQCESFIKLMNSPWRQQFPFSILAPDKTGIQFPNIWSWKYRNEVALKYNHTCPERNSKMEIENIGEDNAMEFSFDFPDSEDDEEESKEESTTSKKSKGSAVTVIEDDDESEQEKNKTKSKGKSDSESTTSAALKSKGKSDSESTTSAALKSKGKSDSESTTSAALKSKGKSDSESTTSAATTNELKRLRESITSMSDSIKTINEQVNELNEQVKKKRKTSEEEKEQKKLIETVVDNKKLATVKQLLDSNIDLKKGYTVSCQELKTNLTSLEKKQTSDSNKLANLLTRVDKLETEAKKRKAVSDSKSSSDSSHADKKQKLSLDQLNAAAAVTQSASESAAATTVTGPSASINQSQFNAFMDEYNKTHPAVQHPQYPPYPGSAAATTAVQQPQYLSYPGSAAASAAVQQPQGTRDILQDFLAFQQLRHQFRQ